MSNAPLLVIAGATGVGKTAAAAALAGRIPMEVVSADSRQVYRGMDAATGKPTPAERAAVAHHLIDIVEPDDRYHAARFVADARRTIDDIRSRGRLPVVVGGTGLYVRALLRGLDPAPPADLEFRKSLAAVAAADGRHALHRRLAAEAPDVARRLHPNDHVRVIRALERVRAGTATMEAGRWARGSSEYRVLYVGLTMDRHALNERLRARARRMAASGLREETARLLARGYDDSLPAMRGIGYRQFVDVVRGVATEADAIALMEHETVQYARRQHTWFAREPDVRWIDVGSRTAPDIAETIHRSIDEEGLSE